MLLGSKVFLFIGMIWDRSCTVFEWPAMQSEAEIIRVKGHQVESTTSASKEDVAQRPLTTCSRLSTSCLHLVKCFLLVICIQFSSVQLLSCLWLFATPWIAARQASRAITTSPNLLKLMSIELMMPSSHLILCRPLLLLPPIPPSIRVFSNESTLCMRWPKYWSFSFSISPSNEHPGLISFRMDWLDLLAVQGTLKSLLQHHSSNPSILWCWAFFTVQFCIIQW